MKTGDFVRIINNIHNELFISKNQLLGVAGEIIGADNKNKDLFTLHVKCLNGFEYTLFPDELEQISETEYLVAQILQL